MSNSGIFVPPGSQLAEFLALCARFGQEASVERDGLGGSFVALSEDTCGLWCFTKDGAFKHITLRP